MKKYGYILFFLLVGSLSFYYYYNTINEFPKHMHAWTQSDRYALAIGFTKNGLDLFHPQTYYLNPQIKPIIKQTEYKGITAVDLPVYDYMAAVFMKLFNSNMPVIFRSLVLAIALCGLFFLFRLTFLLSQNILPALIIIVFAFTCPLYNYFQAGFIPTIPSLALTLTAFYFYTLFIKNNALKHLLIAVVALTIASLARTTFLIFLVAIFLQQVLTMLRNRKIAARLLIYFISAFVIIIAYRFYNIHLQKTYGAAFLSTLRPVNFQYFKEIFLEAYKNWVLHYFTIYHYLLMLVLLVFVLVGIAIKKLLVPSLQKSLFELSGIIFCGCLIFYLLMQSQFNHDYYCLDSFFPLALLMVALFLSALNWKNKFILISAIVGAIFFSVGAIIECNKTLKDRCATGDWDANAHILRAFKRGDSFLNNAGISKDKKILLLNSFSSNIPFILMDRQGFCVIHWERDQILEALTLPFDYIILINKYSENTFSSVPELKKLLKPVAANNFITVYTAPWK